MLASWATLARTCCSSCGSVAARLQSRPPRSQQVPTPRYQTFLSHGSSASRYALARALAASRIVLCTLHD